MFDDVGCCLVGEYWCLVVEAVWVSQKIFESKFCSIGKEVHGDRKEGVFSVDLDTLEQLN